VIDDKRLIGHEGGLDAEGQIGPDFAHRLFDIPSKCQNIAALPHRDGDANRRLAVHPKHGLRRVRISSVDLGDVAQPDQTSIRDKIHRKDVLLRLERARYPQDEPFVPGLQNPGWADDVLRRQRGGQSRPVDPETCELLHREFDEYLFVLSAEDLDLRDVGHLHQPQANVLDLVAELAVGEPVRGNAVDDPEYIAEFVVEPRTYYVGRQRVAHVPDALANVIPDVGDLPGGGLLFQIDKDRRATRARKAAYKIKARRFLQCAL